MAGLIDRTPLTSYLRDKTTLVFSSASLNWKGLHIERHSVPPTSEVLPERYIDAPLLVFFQGRHAARGRYSDNDGTMVSYTKRPGTMTFLPAGRVPALCRANSSDLLLWTMDKRLFARLHREFIKELPGFEPSLRANYTLAREHFSDNAIAQLLLLMQYEVQMGGPSGPRYVESLMRALATRLFARRLTSVGKVRVADDALVSKSILRTIDRINEAPQYAFRIRDLAAEAGYSYQRFFSAFRRATGYSPYQYVMEVRFERAKKLMRNASLSLLDIAIQSGFDSHAHFSFAFRRRYGMSPKAFRDIL